MRITNNSATGLTLQWRSIRLAMTLIVISMTAVFVIGSIFPGVRPTCCVANIGMSCSSCGITRSITAILHGDFGGSRVYHQGGVYLVALTALSLISRPLPFLFPSAKLIAFDAIGFVLAWIIVSVIVFGMPGSGYRTARAEQVENTATLISRPVYMIFRSSNINLVIDARPR